MGKAGPGGGSAAPCPGRLRRSGGLAIAELLSFAALDVRRRMRGSPTPRAREPGEPRTQRMARVSAGLLGLWAFLRTALYGIRRAGKILRAANRMAVGRRNRRRPRHTLRTVPALGERGQRRGGAAMAETGGATLCAFHVVDFTEPDGGTPIAMPAGPCPPSPHPRKASGVSAK